MSIFDLQCNMAIYSHYDNNRNRFTKEGIEQSDAQFHISEFASSLACRYWFPAGIIFVSRSSCTIIEIFKSSCKNSEIIPN